MSFGYQILGFGAGAHLTSISFRSSATSTQSATVTLPADIDPGDLLVLVQKSSDTPSPPADVTPGGWTHINTDTFTSTSGSRMSAKYKIADSGDASASVTGMDGANDTKAALVFKPNIALSSVAVQDWSSEMTNGDPASQLVTASGGSLPLVVIAIYGNLTSVTTRTFTGATEDGEVIETTNQSLYVKHKSYADGPADITIDAPDDGSHNTLAGFYLEVS